MIHFSNSIFIKGNISEVYNAFYNIEKWSKILPHCTKVEMLKTDGERQILLMTVITKGKEETMKSIRFCDKNRSIKYKQPEPPPLLSVHTGEWLFEDSEEGIKVSSIHNVELKISAIKDILGDCTIKEAEELVKKSIENNTMITMRKIKEIIESQNLVVS